MPDKKDHIRVFIALEVSDQVAAKLTEAQNAIKSPDVKIRWVERDNMHVSLAFLGDIPEARVEEVIAVIDQAAAATSPFSFQVNGIGTFGKTRSLRVIWAGIDDSTELLALQPRVAEPLKDTGLFNDNRKFSPHLTIGRVKSQHGSMDLINSVQDMQESEFGIVQVERVVLIRSELKPEGAEYSLLHSAALIG